MRLLTHSLLNEARFTSVTLPGRRTEVFYVGGIDPQAGALSNAVAVAVDPADLSVLGVSRAAQGNLMVPVKTLATLVHYGSWGGVVSLVLWTLFGIMSSFLLLSGARIYAARTAPARAGAAASLPAAIWAGLGVFRWAYLLALLGMIGFPLLQTVL